MPCFNLSETHFSPSWLQLFPKKIWLWSTTDSSLFWDKKIWIRKQTMLLMSHSTPDLNFKKKKKRKEKRSASLVKNKTLLRFGRKCFSKIFTQSVPICRKIIGTVIKKKLCKSSLKWFLLHPKREPSSYSHLFLLDRHQVWRSHDPTSVRIFPFVKKKWLHTLQCEWNSDICF